MASTATMPTTALLSWSLSTSDFDASLLVDPNNSTLRDGDVDSSDAESTPCVTPTGSPQTVMKTTSDTSTPSTVAAVGDTTWIAARPQRRKRKRMSIEERRVRHREVQRQFMKRKRVRIAELRKVFHGVENQLRLITVLSEIEQLQRENRELQKQSQAVQSSPASMVITRCTLTRPAVTLVELDGLMFSLPPEQTDDDIFISEMDWNEIFDVLSDDGAAESDPKSVAMD